MAEELTSTVAPSMPDAQTTDPAAEGQVKQKDPNEKRWAHMARKEKELRAREMRMKSEMQAFDTERKEALATKEWRAKLAQKNFDVLQEVGLTQDDLTQYLVNQPNPQDRLIHELKAELAALKGGQDSIKKQMDDRVSADYKNAVAAIASEATMAVKGDTERFELVHANLEDGVAAATALIEEVWKKTGRVMPVEEALNDVEEYYLETILETANKSKKIKAKLMPEAPVPQRVSQSSGKPAFSTAVRESIERPSVRTLTHQQIPMPSDKPKGRLTDRERRDRAVAVALGKQP